MAASNVHFEGGKSEGRGPDGILLPGAERPEAQKANEATAGARHQPKAPAYRVANTEGVNVTEDNGPAITEEELSARTARTRSDLVKSGAAPKAPRQSRVKEVLPSKTTPYRDVKQTMGLKEYGQGINEAHSMLHAHATTMDSLLLRPEAQARVANAKHHLGLANSAIGRANEARRGVIVGGKRYSGDAEAGKYYDEAVKHLANAHDELADENVGVMRQLHNVTAELPTDHLQRLVDASKTTRVLKSGTSHKNMPLAGGTIDPRKINIKDVENIMGKEAPVTKKIALAKKGRARQDKFKVITGQEEKDTGGLPGRDERTVGRKGMVTTPINPMRPASSARTIEGSLPNANMTATSTPKFDATSKVVGDVATPAARAPQLPKPNKPIVKGTKTSAVGNLSEGVSPAQAEQARVNAIKSLTPKTPRSKKGGKK